MAGSVRLLNGHRCRFRGPADELARLRTLGAHLAPTLAEDVELRMVEGRPALRSGAPLPEAAEDVYLVEADADRRVLAILDRRRELTRRPQVFLEVRDAGTALSIHLARDDRYHRKLARWFLFGALAALGAIRFAHASFVTDGARAALILGPHRSGKSTLVAAALLAGWRIAAEGVSLIDDAGRVVPFFMDGYPVLRLTRRVWREVRGALPGELPEPELYPSRGAGVGEKVVLPVASYWPKALETRPMRASVAWLPAVDRAEPLRIDPVPRRAALASAARELEDRRIGVLRELLGVLPVAEDPRRRLRGLWEETFPPGAFRFSGVLQVSSLVERLRTGELGAPREAP